MTSFTCVWTGQKYGPEYVERLRNAVPGPLTCLTDRDDRIADVDMRPIRHLGLDGWWAKMALFDPRMRGPGRSIYLDLDMVVCGDLAPLMNLDLDFGICANFARAAGSLNWPCRYGSCCMTFRESWGWGVWKAFCDDRRGLIERAGKHGDQWIVERLVPSATLLQDHLPEGFFLHYRDLNRHTAANPGASVVVFAGRHTPVNCSIKWVKDAWQ